MDAGVRKEKVSVIIPTLNEAGNIGAVLAQVSRQNVDEIVVVDGHSTDGTADIVRKMGYRLVMQEGKGLGKAIEKGIRETTGDTIMIVDADGSHDPQDIPKMLNKIREGYDLVVASRYLEGPSVRAFFFGKPSSSYDDTPVREFGNRMLTFLCKVIYDVPVHDVLMGYKVFRRSIFDKIKLTADGQEFDAEIIIKAQKAGFKIGEVPVVEHKRGYGESKLNAVYHGYKILWVIVSNLFSA